MRVKPTQDSASTSRHALLGSLLLFGGILLLALRGLQTVHPLMSFPGFWHDHAALWWGIGLAIAGFGSWLLTQPGASQEGSGWQPSRSGRRFKNLLLYTRPGCHLCDEAREILEQHRRWLPEITEIDIDHDPRLVERYGTCVPVVSLDGKVRFRGRVPAVLLRRLIAATPPREL